MTKSLVIIPTYNEKENILKMIDTVQSLHVRFHILIVDDGSPDGTADLVKSAQMKYPHTLFLMERSQKQGLGTAYIAGFRWALRKKYDYIFEMDCDFSHDPNDLVRLHSTLTQVGTDMVVGSRYVKGGNFKNWPLLRKIISKGASYYVQFLTGLPVKDSTAGFVGYSRVVLESIDLSTVTFKGFAFQIKMKFATWQLGYRITEIPIVFKDREEGLSKMSKDIFWEAVWGVVEMRWEAFFEPYKKKTGAVILSMRENDSVISASTSQQKQVYEN